jgi:hypothetical protein
MKASTLKRCASCGRLRNDCRPVRLPKERRAYQTCGECRDKANDEGTQINGEQ